MATITENDTKLVARQPSLPTDWTMADLQLHLGGIPAERILLNPPPGYATEDDVRLLAERDQRFCELEFGTLVEKPMGWYESILAVLISHKICQFLETHNLGQVLGPDGSLKLLPGIVKIPDASFVSWARFPKEKIPRRPVPALIPDLAVEVLSDTNTAAEMEAKLEKYFAAGVRLVWYVDPRLRLGTMWTGLEQRIEVSSDGDLDGYDILPGFRLSFAWLFQQADRQSAMEGS